MNNNIIARKQEIETFNKLLKSNRAEFLALYGRRRVGKTFLIREYFKSYIQFSFTGSFEEKLNNQLANFFNEYLRRTEGKKETTPPENWSQAFLYLANFLADRKQKKIVIFIDELPWLDTPRSGFLKALEYFWNQHVSAMDNVLLIVCGSAASWMQNKLIRAKGGLYNRVTKRMRLLPFNLNETEQYCKAKKLKLTRYQMVHLYMVMGGIPFYLNELSSGKSAEQLIDELCFSENGLLATEYKQLYYSQYKNASNHVAVIESLASKPNGMSRDELLKQSKLPEGGTFTRTIDDLSESGFITKHQPFNKKNKESLYRLIDFYSLFYLKFIKGNVGKGAHTWQKLSGQSSFKAWSGYAYENICLLHSRQILSKLGLAGTFTEVSTWKHRGNDQSKGTQIDMLIDRKDGVINLCEAKFTQTDFIIDKSYFDTLRRKRSVFSQVTKTRKATVTTLITTYPAVQNNYYLEEIHSEVTMDDLFIPIS